MLDASTRAQMMTRVEPLITEALTRKTGDLPATAGTNTCHREPQPHWVFIGVLPEQLRGLRYLQVELKTAVDAECHRRCTELLGNETYDNEHFEFSVYCQVTDDPQFAGDAVVAARLCEEIEKAFPVTSGTKEHIYVIELDANWNLYLVGKAANFGVDERVSPRFNR